MLSYGHGTDRQADGQTDKQTTASLNARCNISGGIITAVLYKNSTRTRTRTIVLLLFWNLSGSTWVSRYQKGKNQEGKTNLDLLEQEIVSGSGICLAICKSALHLR